MLPWASEPPRRHETVILRIPITAGDLEFFRRVAGTLGQTAGILVTGPGNAKSAFKTYMDHLRPYQPSQVFTVETIDQPSDEALLSLGREHFHVNASPAMQSEQNQPVL
jgi:hypothetical protein